MGIGEALKEEVTFECKGFAVGGRPQCAYPAGYRGSVPGCNRCDASPHPVESGIRHEITFEFH
jgi:hypothetical protein